MDTPTRALVIAAHPDDADFGAGELVARWAAGGCAVTVVCVTDGDSGGFDAFVPRKDVQELRRQEQRAAAKELGVYDVRFLGRPDGLVTVDADLRRDLARLIRELRPEAVVTHAPERDYRFVYLYHPYHLATGAAVLAAVYPDARNEFAFPELGLSPWEVPRVWQFGSPQDDTVVEVTDVFDAEVRVQRARQPDADARPVRGCGAARAPRPHRARARPRRRPPRRVLPRGRHGLSSSRLVRGFGQLRRQVCGVQHQQ